MSDFYAVTAAVPGWYADPHNAAGLRYFDGTQWTEHVAPRPIAPAAPVAWGSQPLPRPLGADPTDPVHWMLPTGRTWQSIAAGYAGLFSILIFPGPIALGLGIWALVASHKTGAHGRGRAIFAIAIGIPTTFITAAVILQSLF